MQRNGSDIQEGEDELDVDAFFLPGGIFDPESDNKVAYDLDAKPLVFVPLSLPVTSNPWGVRNGSEQREEHSASTPSLEWLSPPLGTGNDNSASVTEDNLIGISNSFSNGRFLLIESAVVPPPGFEVLQTERVPTLLAEAFAEADPLQRIADNSNFSENAAFASEADPLRIISKSSGFSDSATSGSCNPVLSSDLLQQITTFPISEATGPVSKEKKAGSPESSTFLPCKNDVEQDFHSCCSRSMDSNEVLSSSIPNTENCIQVYHAFDTGPIVQAPDDEAMDISEHRVSDEFGSRVAGFERKILHVKLSPPKIGFGKCATADSEDVSRKTCEDGTSLDGSSTDGETSIQHELPGLKNDAELFLRSTSKSRNYRDAGTTDLREAKLHTLDESLYLQDEVSRPQHIAAQNRAPTTAPVSERKETPWATHAPGEIQGGNQEEKKQTRFNKNKHMHSTSSNKGFRTDEMTKKLQWWRVNVFVPLSRLLCFASEIYDIFAPIVRQFFGVTGRVVVLAFKLTIIVVMGAYSILEFAANQVLERDGVLLCYVILYTTPAVCDLLMASSSLPHCTPHVISNLALYCLSAYISKFRSKQVKSRPTFQSSQVTEDLSQLILRTLRLYLPVALVSEGFSRPTSNVMMLEASTRLIIAYFLSMLRNGVILSPLGWVGWSLQVLYSSSIPEGVFSNWLLCCLGLAFLRLMTVLGAETVTLHRLQS